MKKYFVTFEVYAATTVEVRAESEEKAKEIASKRVHVSLCHQCSRELDVGDVGEIIDAGEAS